MEAVTAVDGKISTRSNRRPSDWPSSWPNWRGRHCQMEGPSTGPHHGRVGEGAMAKWQTSPQPNRRPFNWTSSLPNRSGRRDQIEDIATTRSKAPLHLELIMAEWEKPPQPNRRLSH